MVSVYQFCSLCLRHSHRHPHLPRHRINPTYDRVRLLKCAFRSTVNASRLTYERPSRPYSPRSRRPLNPSNEGGPIPETDAEFEHHVRAFQPFNSLRRSPNAVVSEQISEWDEEMGDEAEAYEATELDLQNQEPPNLSNLSNLEALRDTLAQKYYDGLNRFLPAKSSRDKPDLSYTDVLAWEKETGGSRRNDATLTFKSNTGLRRIMLAYVHKIEPIVSSSTFATRIKERDALLTVALSSVFPSSDLETLAKAGFDVSDVVCWSWIFTAPAVDVSVFRYVLLMEDFRSSRRPRQIPKFVVLQLLRSASIGQFALKRLVETLLLELHDCHERKSYQQWHYWVTRVCLVVRLLRHARQTDPSLLKEIALIVRHLFSDFYNISGLTQTPHVLEKLAHVYNRFLSLISLASPKEPFKWSLHQQNAQLALVRLMLEFKPQLPVTREGFRALIKVQLLHKKTAEERSWAEAKSLSWPPWRQDKLGIEEDLGYPGKESRAMRLLRRMREAGYAHGPWEQAASILAGWDTDRSPAIQTRSILRRAMNKFFPEREESNTAETVGHNVWTARVRSTRSKLEAWAAFSAYVKSTPLAQRQCWPYYAMLEKLMAKTVETQSVLGSRYLPGDLRETFTDPINPNQRVYVETKVPTTNDFYLLMLHDGFKPAGGLLCQLLQSAANIQTGFRYVIESKFNEAFRDVLLHAEKYPHSVLKQKLRQVRPDFLAAFYGLLSRYGFESHPQLNTPGSCTGEALNYSSTNHSSMDTEVSKLRIRPLMYARQLLQISEEKSITPWNGFLKGSATCVADARRLVVDEVLTVSEALDIEMEVWRCIGDTFNVSNLQSLELNPDLYTFRHMAWLVQSLIGDAHFQSSRSTYLVEVTKSVFVNAAYGQNRATWPDFAMTMPPLSVPEPHDIRMMVRLMVSAHDIEGLLAMVKWLNHHANTFKPIIAEPLEGAGQHHGYRGELEVSHLRGTLCAIRLFLEGSKGLSSSGSTGSAEELWFDTPLQVHESDIETARNSCQPLRWPTDEQVHIFLARNMGWVFKAAQAADFTSRKEAMYSKNQPARFESWHLENEEFPTREENEAEAEETQRD